VSELHRVTVNPDQYGGRPCIRGLRIRVKDVLDLLAAGASRERLPVARTAGYYGGACKCWSAGRR
jgi:uncharacterized protein (DUF433 family)